MATQTVMIQVDRIDAPFLQALVAKAENAGKTLVEMFDELKSTGQPLTVAMNGGAVVLQDVESYQRLLAEAEQAESLAGVQRGLEAMKAGRIRPVKEFLDELRQEFGFPEKRPE
jgi:PHD/YefM family antitoxin component YafN of YafNO toxin-antitoxin module